MFSIFKILKTDQERKGYPETEFDRTVYPYFREHGDYKKYLTEGKKVDGGVEDIHAKRVAEAIDSLDAAQKENALIGAKNFADRQADLWSGLNKELTRVAAQQAKRAL